MKKIKDVRCETEKNNNVITDGKILITAMTDCKTVRIVFVLLSVLCIVSAILILPHVRYSIFALLCLLSFIMASLGLLIGKQVEQEFITVSENCICVRGVFGKEMFIAFDSITTVKKTHFGTVCIVAHSCKTWCMFVKNCDEVIEVIKEKTQNMN